WEGRLVGTRWHRPLVSQVLRPCLLILVISIELPFRLHFCPPYIHLWFSLMRRKRLISSDILEINLMDSTSSYQRQFTGRCSSYPHSQQLSRVNHSYLPHKQSVVLDYFPRVKVSHTSSSKEGEVSSPEVDYILMVLCVAVILIFGDGQDLGNAFGVVVSMVMLITTILLTLVMITIWRISPILTSKRLRELLSDPGVQRVPGLCFFYSNIQDGLTPVPGHYIKNMKSLHTVTVFTTLCYLLVPKVRPQQRILVKKLGIKGVYGCVIQYGYCDSLCLQGDKFVTQLINALHAHLVDCSVVTPLSDEKDIEDETLLLEESKKADVVHVRGKPRFHIGDNCGWFDVSPLSLLLLSLFNSALKSGCFMKLEEAAEKLEMYIDVSLSP
ncbi:hypothetical protein Drorol1_Dr00012158, partial [Drosera rotundifolia]